MEQSPETCKLGLERDVEDRGNKDTNLVYVSNEKGYENKNKERC